MTSVMEFLAWTLVWPLLAVLIDRLIHRRTPERRVARLLGWYPRVWRERHGAGLAERLDDAIADGRDGPRLSLHVAREGLAERLRSASGTRVSAGFLAGLGWTMILPQGIVAAVLGEFDGVPPSWFVALDAGGDERWLLSGAMVGLGVLLVDRGMRMFAPGCPAGGQGAR